MKEVKDKKQVKNNLPFDVVNNLKLLEKQIDSKNSLMEWVKKQPNFKGVIPFHFTPIVENQKQYDTYNFEVDDNVYFIRPSKVENIPLGNLEITTDKDCNINSITMIITKNGKQYKVISKKDYGIIKSRYLLDSKGKFKNYEKCDLVLYDGEYKEYRWNNSNWGYDCVELNKVFNYKNGIKHGECSTYYKGDYPYHSIGRYNDNNKYYWYEMFTYHNGRKEGLYENTKNLERGNLLNGKRVDEWIVKPSDDVWIPNFYKEGRRKETLRIKCNYHNYNLEGKWEGITIEEFFGIPYKYETISKVGGEFKNGIMDGEFYSEFWNDKYLIIQGTYQNNKPFGDWITKKSDVGIIPDSFREDDDENMMVGKHWYSYNEGRESFFTIDEVSDYSITKSTYDSWGKSVKSTTETYKNNELVKVCIRNHEDFEFEVHLEKGVNPFHKYTEELIPNEYKNKGLSVTFYRGLKDGKGENDVIHFNIRENNIFGFHGEFNNKLLINNGYPYTHEGKNRWDRRKKDTFPTLPSNYEDFFGMGEYVSGNLSIGDSKISLISINDELFMETVDDKEFKSKRNQIIQKVVKLLSDERQKELNEIKEKESKDFSLFPMD